jgi:O-acetyl-ADP-ribose deacetylase (regulator of RNase III)
MGKLHFVCGEYITNSSGMDAIVNSQNKDMVLAQGICGEVYKAAGLKLLEYCKSTYSEEMKVGEVRITPGFNLDMDIIHVLPPIFSADIDPNNEEDEGPINRLMNVYENLLHEIKTKKYKKVLLPSIGTGFAGYKNEDMVKPLINLLNGFCKINDIDLYLSSLNPTINDLYLNYYLKLNKINLKKELNKLDSIDKIKKYLSDEGFVYNDIKNKYKRFVADKDLNDMQTTDKLICLEFSIENFNININQARIIINSL